MIIRPTNSGTFSLPHRVKHSISNFISRSLVIYVGHLTFVRQLSIRGRDWLACDPRMMRRYAKFWSRHILENLPYASSNTAPCRCNRDGDREIPPSLIHVHRLLCTFASRGASLITGAFFALERPLVDRWWGMINSTGWIIEMIWEGSTEVCHGQIWIGMGIHWKWPRTVLRRGIFLPLVFISVFLVLAFKIQKIVHIVDGGLVTYTLKTWQKIVFTGNKPAANHLCVLFIEWVHFQQMNLWRKGVVGESSLSSRLCVTHSKRPSWNCILTSTWIGHNFRVVGGLAYFLFSVCCFRLIALTSVILMNNVHYLDDHYIERRGAVHISSNGSVS